MRDKIATFILKSYINIRWAYLHLNPRYMKFYIGNEPHFQHLKLGTIHSNLLYAPVN